MYLHAEMEDESAASFECRADSGNMERRAAVS
jgi:hypothetical protein